MAFKNVVVISMIFAFFMAAQAPVMQAQILPLTNLIRVIVTNVQNTVTGLPIANLTSSPISGALALVNSATSGLVGVGITDPNGSVTVTLPQLLPTAAVNTLLNSLLNGGNIIINSPIAIVNSTLPTTVRALVSRLQLTGNTTTGLIRTISLSPIGFNLTIAV